MRKIIFISIIVVIVSSFSLLSSADEYDRDDAFISWKLMAYAMYPAGYIAENLVIKPGHWLLSLPYLKDISGHEELSKALVEDETDEETIKTIEDVKAPVVEMKITPKEIEEAISRAESSASKAETIATKAKDSATEASSAATLAEESAAKAEAASTKAEEAATEAERASEKAVTIFDKMLKK